MHTDLDTLVIALYVKIDDALQAAPELRPWRPAVGIASKLTDAGLLTLAVMQALLGYTSEARWLRYARTALRHLFPYLPVSPATTSGCGSCATSSGRWRIKGYRDAETEAILDARGVTLLRPAYKGGAPRAGQRLFGPLRQLIESVNDTLRAQLDLERHGGRTIQGVTVRVLQRLLALTAAIWHNHKTGQPALRSLIAYDHC